jgi:SAM-dependent methyltransferase
MSDLRFIFGEDAANYDRMRPRYVPEVFADILKYSGAREGSRALEAGIGTGQATEPFLRAGCALTAVEISAEMAAFSREKFKTWPGFAVVNAPFEEFNGEGGGFDLIYSATAFHWIPREIGYARAYELLKSGGALALFWNRPFTGKPGSALHRDIQKVYGEFFPGGKEPAEYDAKLYEGRKAAMASAGFADVEFRLYRGLRRFDAEGYVALLNTYSDHRSMAPPAKRAFEQGIRAAVEANGGVADVYDTVDLHLGRKP